MAPLNTVYLSLSLLNLIQGQLVYYPDQMRFQSFTKHSGYTLSLEYSNYISTPDIQSRVGCLRGYVKQHLIARHK